MIVLHCTIHGHFLYLNLCVDIPKEQKEGFIGKHRLLNEKGGWFIQEGDVTVLNSGIVVPLLQAS